MHLTRRIFAAECHLKVSILGVTCGLCQAQPTMAHFLEIRGIPAHIRQFQSQIGIESFNYIDNCFGNSQGLATHLVPFKLKFLNNPANFPQAKRVHKFYSIYQLLRFDHIVCQQ